MVSRYFRLILCSLKDGRVLHTINLLPLLTSTQVLPRAWAACAVSLTQLLACL